uniref:Uncharacterized protein n=1 Tax=Rhodosorus marinus TaxID=101924 RepID=A0A7S2ZVH8_9RHOD
MQRTEWGLTKHGPFTQRGNLLHQVIENQLSSWYDDHPAMTFIGGHRLRPEQIELTKKRRWPFHRQTPRSRNSEAIPANQGHGFTQPACEPPGLNPSVESISKE